MIHPFNTTLTTERLFLRPLHPDDVEDMFEYTSNPLVTTFLSWEPHDNIRITKEFIDGVIAKYNSVDTEFTFGIELKLKRKLIGAIKVLNINYYNKRAEFTSILNPLFQGKGFMAETWESLLDYCFNTVGLNRIQSYVTVDNLPSQKKNDRAGLRYEGRLKEWWYMKGIFKDALVYAITAEEFIKRNSSIQK